MRKRPEVALLFAASIAGCSTAPAETGADAAVSDNVRSALASSGAHLRYSVSVRTANGAVKLSGFVGNKTQRLRAGAVAASVQGVTAVENDLVVMPPKGNPSPPQGGPSPR
jgi:osmotically-inducible protein OsmY